jgi:hypothetical protein
MAIATSSDTSRCHNCRTRAAFGARSPLAADARIGHSALVGRGCAARHNRQRPPLHDLRENILEVRRVAFVILVLASLTVACSNSSNSSESPQTAGPSTTVRPATTTMPIGHNTVPATPVDQLPLGAAHCSPPSPLGSSNNGFPETKGTTVNDVQLYGLVMPAAGLPLRVGEEIKFVWRMTGHGPLAVTATSSSGAPTSPTFGPEEHGGSNYDRPGDEWGTGYRFTEPGCWRLHLARDDTQGDVWFNITAE